MTRIYHGFKNFDIKKKKKTIHKLNQQAYVDLLLKESRAIP